MSAAETKTTTLETTASNAGSALEVICKSIDTSTNMCCVNQSNNKLVCATGGTAATLLGITEQATAGTCGPATDTICV